ncbi:MAG: hypothetical protein ACJA2F_001369 [Nitriliruptoraceae bacterium]|jgi:hypothetical protein
MRIRTALTTSLAMALAVGSLAGLGDLAVGETAGSAARDGDVVAFQGAANRADPGESEIPNFFVTDFADPAAADALGIDLDTAAISELDDASGLRFSWRLGSSMTEGLPEVVRYNWGFQSGDQTFQLQVKRTNVANSSTVESPLDHATQLADGGWWYQLRGACVVAYPTDPSPLQGCYHLGFFDGDVDLANGVISMELPYEAFDEVGRQVAGTFKRGTPIVEAQSATMSITASAQAAVSNASTSAFLNGWGTYYPGTVVYAALGNESAVTGSYGLLDTAGDGSFAGSLEGAGTHVWIKDCTGYGVQGLTADPCTKWAIAIG